MNFSTGNGCSHTNLRENDLDSLRLELAKVLAVPLRLFSALWSCGSWKLMPLLFFYFKQTEDEIQTLRQVLLAKEKYAADIRRQLGLSPLSNVKQNLCKGWQEVKTSAPWVHADFHKHETQRWKYVCIKFIKYCTDTSVLTWHGYIITKDALETFSASFLRLKLYVLLFQISHSLCHSGGHQPLWHVSLSHQISARKSVVSSAVLLCTHSFHMDPF